MIQFVLGLILGAIAFFVVLPMVATLLAVGVGIAVFLLCLFGVAILLDL